MLLVFAGADAAHAADLVEEEGFVADEGGVDEDGRVEDVGAEQVDGIFLHVHTYTYTYAHFTHMAKMYTEDDTVYNDFVGDGTRMCVCACADGAAGIMRDASGEWKSIQAMPYLGSCPETCARFKITGLTQMIHLVCEYISKGEEQFVCMCVDRFAAAGCKCHRGMHAHVAAERISVLVRDWIQSTIP